MRRLITLGLLGALACLALPAGASARANPAIPKFRVLIQATQTTTWTKPLKVRDRDCFNRPWSKGSGSETVTMKGTAIIYGQDIGGFTYGSPDYGPGGQQGVPLRVTATRRNDSLYGSLPGQCGGGSPEERIPYECDDAISRYVGQLRWKDARRLELYTTPQRGASPLSWRYCPLNVAKAVYPGNITTISQVAPQREVFDPSAGKQIILARKTFREVLYPGNGDIDTTTTTRWQITLYRLKK